jgi:hypothetical protein
VPGTAILAGLACGALLTTAGFALWHALRPLPGLSQAVQALGWLAGALLLSGALSARLGGGGFPPWVPHLLLMAALATPAASRSLPGPRRSAALWDDFLRLLPPLALAWAGLLCTATLVGGEVSGPPVGGGPPAQGLELAIVVCGGLGARALGQAFGEIVTSTPGVAWPSAAAYAWLTVLVGGVALASLAQRGSVWDGTPAETGLAGVWLAWSAAWLSPRQPARLRTALTAVTAAFLIALAARWPLPSA